MYTDHPPQPADPPCPPRIFDGWGGPVLALELGRRGFTGLRRSALILLGLWLASAVLLFYLHNTPLSIATVTRFALVLLTLYLLWMALPFFAAGLAALLVARERQRGRFLLLHLTTLPDRQISRAYLASLLYRWGLSSWLPVNGFLPLLLLHLAAIDPVAGTATLAAGTLRQGGALLLMLAAGAVWCLLGLSAGVFAGLRYGIRGALVVGAGGVTLLVANLMYFVQLGLPAGYRWTLLPALEMANLPGRLLWGLGLAGVLLLGLVRLPWRGDRQPGSSLALWVSLAGVGLLAVSVLRGGYPLRSHYALEREAVWAISALSAARPPGPDAANHCSWGWVSCDRAGFVRELDLFDSQLKQLPPEIGQLAGLQILWLSDNQLTALPPEIGQLSRLETLNLWDNHLVALPPEIGQLANLRWLSLWNNQLTALPPEIGQLTSLRQLYLYSNDLETLPPEMEQLASLRVLNLEYNHFEVLPVELCPLLPQLDTLLAATELKVDLERRCADEG